MNKLVTLLIFLLSVQLGVSQELNLTELSNWRDTGSQRYNDCWGFVQGGREYAAIGSRYGTHIIDVTDPNNIFEVDRVQGRHSAENVIHRDFKDYNGYLYAVGDQGDASLQIMDLSYLPDSVSLVYDEDSLILRSHNIFIDTLNARLYTCGGAIVPGWHNYMNVLDISNPINPKLIVDCSRDLPWWDVFVGYVHDVYVKDNMAYVHDEDAFHIIDFTDPVNPSVLGQLSGYTDQGYNHSGWLHEDGETYIMFDETPGKRIKTLDVSNPIDTRVSDVFGTYDGIDTNTLAHNGYFLGDMAYVSYYDDGVYVYDVTDRNNVEIEGYYYIENGPFGSDSRGVWGVYPYLPSGNIIASDIGSGLHVLAWEEPEVNFSKVLDTVYEDSAMEVEVSLSHAYHKEVQVDVQINGGTAVLNDDYTVGAAQLTFPPNYSKAQKYVVSTIENGVIEGIETVDLELVNSIGAPIGSQNQYTLYINDSVTWFASIEELNRNVLSVYPNPIIKGETVTFKEPLSFNVFDVSGKMIVEDEYGVEFHTGILEEGLYIIQSNKGIIRLVVQ